MLVDVHCHIQADEFAADRDAVIARCRKKNMRCVVVGNNVEDSKQAIGLAQQHDILYAAIGLHPINIADEEWNHAVYEPLLKSTRVVAIGEIGLDYNRIWADSAAEEQKVKQEQRDVLEQQLAFARDHNKPVVIHCRDAYDDLLAVLRAHRQPFMVHTFLGDEATAQAFLEIEGFLSFSGIITFENEDELVKTVRAVPLEKMMIETDAPYLAPVPYRGKRNEPAYVEETAKKIADIQGVSPEQVIEVTSENAKNFFGL